MNAVAAVVFALTAAGAVAFQLALAAGAPWGTYAMGGRFPGVFPPGMRVAAVVQGAVIAGLAVIVLGTAGALDLAALRADGGLAWLRWVPVAFSALSLVVNLASPSPGERRIWVPVALVLLASSLVVAVA